MNTQLALAVAVFVAVSLGIWVYTTYVEFDWPRSRVKQATIAVAISVGVVAGGAFIPYMPLRAMAAVGLAFLAAHVVDSVACRVPMN